MISNIEKMYEKFRRLDVCFNNAGVAPGIVGSDSSLDKIQFESYIDKTFTATGPHNPIKSHLVNLITNYLNYSMNKLLNQVPVSCY